MSSAAPYYYSTHFFPAQLKDYSSLTVDKGEVLIIRFLARRMTDGPIPTTGITWDGFAKRISQALVVDFPMYDVLGIRLTRLGMGGWVQIVGGSGLFWNKSTVWITEDRDYVIDLVVRPLVADSAMLDFDKWVEQVQEACRGMFGRMPIVNLVGILQLPLSPWSKHEGTITPELQAYYAATYAAWSMSDTVIQVMPSGDPKNPSLVTFVTNPSETDGYLGKNHNGLAYGFADGELLEQIRLVKLGAASPPGLPPGTKPSFDIGWVVFGAFGFVGYKLWKTVMGDK